MSENIGSASSFKEKKKLGLDSRSVVADGGIPVEE